MPPFRTLATRFVFLIVLLCIIIPLSAQAAKEEKSAATVSTILSSISVTGKARVAIPANETEEYLVDVSIQISHSPTVKAGIDTDKQILQDIKIKAMKVAVFKAGKALKDAVR